MRLKPKYIGDDCSLDDYNALQYLLYHMDCWNETILLNTYTPYEGKYAKYIFKEQDNILSEKNETFTITEDFTQNNPYIIIQLSDINELLQELHIEYTITLHIKKPLPSETVTITTEDGTTYSEEITPHPIDNYDLNQRLQEESHRTPNVYTDYEELTLTAEYDKTNKKLKIPLFADNKSLLPETTVLHRQVEIHMNLNKKPYIDIKNGKANEINEILLDNPKELLKIIKHAPTNQKTIIRLDSNKQYLLEETIIIKNGQNIEIRGGTNTNAELDGTNCHRTIIINPGGQLTLKNITISNNDSTKTNYDKYHGGAILVEAKTTKKSTTFGVLECDSCTFKNNRSLYGGAIFSYRAGVYINNCRFLNNTSQDGGAIYYHSKDINLLFKDIYAIPGETINPTVNITDYAGRTIKTGNIKFYINTDKETEIISKIVNGKASFTYEIPKNYKKTEFTITAVYDGTINTDLEVAKCTVYVKPKEIYTAILEAPDTINKGESLILTATVKTSNNIITNNPEAFFTLYDGKTYTGNRIDNKYQFKFTVPKDAPDKLELSFQLKTEECNIATKSITAKTIPAKPNTNNIYGLFINMEGNIQSGCGKNTNVTITEANIDTFIEEGITDLYVGIRDYSTDTKRIQTLKNITEICKNKSIRVHATIHSFFDMTKDHSKWGWIKPDKNSERITELKNQIDEITKLAIDGICFYWLRYSGADGQNSTYHTHITNAMKELYNKIKGINKNYIISTCVIPEPTNASSYYGQNYKELAQYNDYLQVLTYKWDYRGTNNDNTDEWVNTTIKTIQDEITPKKVVSVLQTYTDDGKNKCGTEQPRSRANLNTTINYLAKNSKPYGITLFRYGVLTEYPDSYIEIMEG